MKTIRITEKELKEMIENQLNNNIDEVVSIDAETAEREPDLVKKISDKIGDKEIIKIDENQLRKLIENNEKSKISKKKLLETLKIK